VKTQEAAKVSLTKRNLNDKKFAVGILIDNSGSMTGFYGRGKVQKLAEFALGYAFEVDTDGLIPVGVFGDSFYWASTDLTQDNYQDFIRLQGWNGNDGSTNTARALDAADKLFDNCDDPAIIIVVTDGRPNSESAVMDMLTKMSRKPVFVKWLTIGSDPDAARFAKKIDDDLKGLVDNVDSKNYTSGDLVSLTSEKFAEDMSDELDKWLDDAKSVGLVR
jgi:uncharacterized protein with von Willebrand factor type A (vWA) domain